MQTKISDMKSIIYLISLLLTRGVFYAGTFGLFYYTIVLAAECQNHIHGIFIAIGGGALCFILDFFTKFIVEIIKFIYDRGNKKQGD